MTEGSSSTAPFASSAEDMTPQERLGVVNWLTESPASCWSDSSKVLERAIPRIRDETKKRGRQTPQSSGQDSSGLPDPTIGPPGDEEQESDDEADIPSGKRPKTGRKEGGSAPGPSASSRSSGSSDTPSTRASPSPTPPASKTPAGAVANLNGRPKRDDDALLPDVHDIPVVHQEIVREFSTMSAHLAQSTRSRLNALVVSLARATTWRDDHWRSIWEPDRSTVVTPTGTSTSNATPAPASASNAASAPASSSSIEKLARLFNTIVKRTQYDEAVERLYLVLLRCEIVWDAGKTHSPDEGAASGLADKIGCKRLVTEHRRRAARYTQMANVLGNGVLLSLGEGPRRWDRLHRDELDIIRDFFRGKPHCSLVQQWLSSDELVRQLTFMGLLRLGWQGAEAFKILNRVLPAATISSRTVSPRPGVNESARSPSQDVVTSIEPSSIHLAPFDGVAPYGPIYDTQAASILERSSPEVEVFELQPFDGSGST